jgi:HSP20 family molecular chaperone IbpA
LPNCRCCCWFFKVKPVNQESVIYRGIKRSGFDLSWKISVKFEISKLEAKLEKGLLILDIPYAESKKPKQIEIK